jgi:hypothetical protein
MTRARCAVQHAGDTSSMADHGELTRAQHYDRIRNQIEHEDQQVNLRVIWQLIAQAFFFSAYTALLAITGQPKNHMFDGQQSLLLWLIPVIGLLAGLFTSIGIFSSLGNIEHLRGLYEGYSHDGKPEDESARLFPPIQGPERFRKLGKISPIGLPVLLTVAWIIILIRLLIDAAH